VTAFRIGAHLGSGGFGSVERADRLDEAGNVIEEGLAQKRLLPEHEEDEEALGRFRREVRMLAAMDHPHVLPVLGRNLSDSPPWFIMPEAESSLQGELAAGKNGDEDWLINTFAAVLDGMTYAHNQGNIHRDLKPANVLFVQGVPMISDFGLGKRLGTNTEGLTQTHMAMGTAPYMAPEQFRDAARVGPPADVYALGKLLVEMITGVVPAVGRPRTDVLPERFRSFIEKCTEEGPADRYANAADAAAAFRLLISDASQDADEGSLEALLQRWEGLSIADDAEVVEEIMALLVSHRSQEELLWDVFPRLPQQLVEQMMQDHEPEFDLVLRAYNGHIQGGLPFAYSDVVANFYRRLFQKASIDQKRVLLKRLIELGPAHNRWHVGEVVADILQRVEGPEAIAAAELLRADPVNAKWFDPYVRNLQLAAPVAKAFGSLDPRPSDESGL
jgi:serine/threonine protein kinase